TRQKIDRRFLPRYSSRTARDLAGKFAARARVVLQVMCFVKDEACARDGNDRVQMTADNVVVGDDPAGVAWNLLFARALHEVDRSLGSSEGDFARPIALH